MGWNWKAPALGVMLACMVGIFSAPAALAQITLPINGPYTENFNTTPGVGGTTLPAGWYWSDSSIAGTALTVGNNASNTIGFYNFGSRLGAIRLAGTDNVAYYVLALENTYSRTNFRLSYRAENFSNGPVIPVINIDASSATWEVFTTDDPTFFYQVPVANSVYNSVGVSEGDFQVFNNLTLAPLMNNNPDTVYILFKYTGTGTPVVAPNGDGLALDNFSLEWDLIPLEANLGPDVALCPGLEATFSVPNLAGVDVLWSTGSTDTSLTTTTAGTYWVTLTDALGRTASDTVVVTNLPAPTGVVINAHPSSEAVLYDGSAINPDTVCANLLTAYEVGAPSGFSAADYGTGWQIQPGYTFIDVATGQAPVGIFTATLASGSLPRFDFASDYADGNHTFRLSLVIENIATGCTLARSRYVYALPAPIPTLLPAEARFCPGESNLLLDASSPQADTYIWGPGSETTATLAVTTAGTYTVTVRGFNGCDYSTSTVVGNETFVLNLGPDTLVCLPFMLDATYDGPPQGVTYQWSSGETSPVIWPTLSGDYAALVTTPYGCEFLDTVSIVADTLPVSLLASAYSTCANVAVNLSPGTPYAQHLWNTGETTTNISTLNPGTYWVQITKGNCVVSDTTTVSTLPIPVPDLGADRALCRPAFLNTGISDLTDHTVLWSLGYTTPTMQVMLPGTYSVEVTDANGCTGRDTVTVALRDTLHLNMTATPQPAAPGQTITIGAQPSSPNVSGAQWYWTMGNGDFSLIQGGFSYVYPNTGTYPLVLTFNDGECEATDTLWITIANPTGLADETQTVWSASPNPVRDILWLRGLAPATEWTLMDTQGRQLAQGTTPSTAEATAISMAHLPVGVYVLRIRNGQSIRVVRQF